MLGIKLGSRVTILSAAVDSTGNVYVSDSSNQTVSDGFQPLFENLAAPADIGFDSGRKKLLVPLFNDDAILIKPLPESVREQV